MCDNFGMADLERAPKKKTKKTRKGKMIKLFLVMLIFMVSAHSKTVLVLGDSYTWGHGINRNDTYVNILRRETDNIYIDTSKCGLNTMDELLISRKYNADSVIIQFCMNDIETHPQYNMFNSARWKLLKIKPFAVMDSVILSRTYPLQLTAWYNGRRFEDMKKHFKAISLRHEKIIFIGIPVNNPAMTHVREYYKVINYVKSLGWEVVDLYPLIKIFGAENTWASRSDWHLNKMMHEIMAYKIQHETRYYQGTY